MAVHVRYKSLYISFPSSRKQQGEIAEFCGFFFCRTRTKVANVCYFYLEFPALHIWIE